MQGGQGRLGSMVGGQGRGGAVLDTPVVCPITTDMVGVLPGDLGINMQALDEGARE